MSKFPKIGEKLPEGSKHERQRARFLGITIERLRFLQWHQPYRRWWKKQWDLEQLELSQKKPAPSD